MDTNAHNSLRHLKALRQTLSQNNKPIGFFISAGCPLAIPMPSNEWPLIPDMKGLSRYVKDTFELKPIANDYNKLIEELKKTQKKEDNLEEVLSFIRSLKEVSKGGTVRGFEEDKLEELESEVCNCIVEKIKVELPNKQTPYHKLARWISSIERDKAIEVFTTNYDLLIEQAFEETSVPYYDGFVGARHPFFDLKSVEGNLAPKHWTRLWKIHGSINWFLKKDKKDIFRASSVKLEDGFSHLIYPSHLKYEQSRKMPFLALSDQLSRFLKQPSAALILCGYSFNDEHINDTMINALKANPTAIIIALMFGNMSREDETDPSLRINNYEKGIELAENTHNLSLWTDDEAIIGTNRGYWGFKDSDETIKKFIQSEDLSGDKKYYVKMGDFKNLSDFLIFLIGNNEEYDK